MHDSGLAQHLGQRLHLGIARVRLRKSTGRGGTKKRQACGAEGGEGPARRWRQIGDATAGVAGVLKSTSGRMCPSGGSQAADGGGGRQWRSIARRLPTLRPKRGMEEYVVGAPHRGNKAPACRLAHNLSLAAFVPGNMQGTADDTSTPAAKAAKLCECR